jgi:hypothetical protein
MKFFTNSIRLNGWHRLYIVCVVFLITPLAYFETRNLDLDPPSSAALIEMLPITTRQLMNQHDVVLRMDQKLMPNTPVDWDKVAIDLSGYEEVEVVSISSPFGRDYTLTYRKELDEKLITSICLQMSTSLANAATQKRWDAFWKDVFFKYFLIALALASGGFAVAWVRNGFNHR